MAGSQLLVYDNTAVLLVGGLRVLVGQVLSWCLREGAPHTHKRGCCMGLTDVVGAAC